MVESQGKQLHELLQAFTSTSAVDIFQPMADKLEQQPQEAKQALFDEISTKHPYIEQVSEQLIDLLMPQLQGFMLAACQQALEKGHQSAMVQQQTDEDEQLNNTLEQLKILQEAKKFNEDKNTEFENEFLHLKIAFDKSSNENLIIKKQLDESKVEIEKFEHLIEQTDHALTKQKEHNALQSTKLKQLITQRSEEKSLLAQKFEQLLKEVNLLKADKKKLTEDLKSTKQALLGSSDTLVKFENTNTAISESNAEYEKDNARLVEDIKKLEQRLSVSKAEIDKLGQNSKFDFETLEQKFQSEIEALEHQAKTELDKLEQQHIVKLDELKQQTKALKENSDASTTKNEERFNDFKKDLREETKHLEAALLEAQSNIETLEQDKKEFIEQVDKLKEQSIEYRDEILKSQNKLEAQGNELNFAKGRNSSMQSRQETEIHQARAAYEGLRSENIEHTQTIEDLEAKVMEFKLKFEYAQKQLVS
ncbi:hypothetical protein CJF42_01995 [Pseudoalteromonas sp. NBT06-2]|uniref:hypothetical protein n=1 Tax=Pseudoalteromonas sp. NBT06-2 TaxID=2025950 RepID=UPI000BA69FEB|nr:hypothetical protein [Pseudoalteromonas sp. NBT06-2]PAJ76031.1 hypothetical protein CJF42_01995 [Pseudoalteromonas sp. NBT06-2]